LLDYSDISNEKEVPFAEWLVKEKGVAAIPLSVFYRELTNNRLLRFCFAKSKDTVDRAAEILHTL